MSASRRKGLGNGNLPESLARLERVKTDLRRTTDIQTLKRLTILEQGGISREEAIVLVARSIVRFGSDHEQLSNCREA